MERSLLTEKDDDDELLHHLFQQMDSNKDGRISKEELNAALQSKGNKELVEALTGAVVGMQQDEAGIDFEAFKAGANLVSWRALSYA
jgi:Ca2+-binding EF-hand superfamily protein